MPKLLTALTVLALTTVPATADVSQPLGPGDDAPDFSLPGSDGNVHELAALRERGAVVIAWFPKAFTSGCTVQCKALAKDGHRIKDFEVTYFMASVDPVDANSAFAKEHGADFAILSDTTKEVAKAYGVLSQYGFSSRDNVYIGTDGKILAIERNVNPSTAVTDIIAKLEELGIPKHSAESAEDDAVEQDADADDAAEESNQG